MLCRFFIFLSLYLFSIFSVDAFSATPSNPSLSRPEIQKLLDVVPVYAVTESEKGGIVLVSEKENDNEIAYFFFNPETANSIFSPLRKKKEDDSSWDVTQFSLGLVWFELFQNPAQNVEYRLVPDSRELSGARKILSPEDAEPTDYFKAAFNEIPVFVDQSLRLQGRDGGKKLPMYFSFQDLLESCQQAGGSGDYEPTISVANFCTLVEQMQVESENDFRNVILVPPSQLLLPGEPSTIEAESKDSEPFSTPTATDSWDD